MDRGTHQLGLMTMCSISSENSGRLAVACTDDRAGDEGHLAIVDDAGVEIGQVHEDQPGRAARHQLSQRCRSMASTTSFQ